MGDRYGGSRYRPEAMERLRQGFEAQAERRRRKQAPRIAYGQRLAAEQGLGQLGDVFRLHRTSWWWGPSVIVLFLLLIFGIPFVLLYGIPADLRRTPLERGLGLLLEGGGWVMWIVLLFRNPGRDEWLYCCDAGFVHVRDRARPLRVTRWDEVTAVYRSWVKTYHPGISEDDSYFVPAGHVLALRGGANVSLTGDYQNVLDPLPSMRRQFEAMRPVGEVLPRFLSLGGLLERAVTDRLLPPAMAAYERGEVVWFGPVGVGRQGITVAPAQATLAWTEFGGLAQARQELVILSRQPGSQKPGPDAERESRPSALKDMVHNFGVLLPNLDLVKEVNSAGRRRAGSGDAWQVLDMGSIPNLCVLVAMLAQLEEGGGTARA